VRKASRLRRVLGPLRLRRSLFRADDRCAGGTIPRRTTLATPNGDFSNAFIDAGSNHAFNDSNSGTDPAIIAFCSAMCSGVAAAIPAVHTWWILAGGGC